MDNNNNSPNSPNPLDPASPLGTPSQPAWPNLPVTPSNQQPPTFTPTDTTTPTSLNPSPLDNPWGAPLQPPPIDGSQSSQPTWVANTTDTATTPQPIGPEPTAAGGQLEPAPIQSESAPTDLSHLISNNSQENSGQNPPSLSPETLVMPSPTSSIPEVPTVPTGDHKGIPKWLIGVGVGLLITVVGASAYFILGIGQPPKTTSVPAEVLKTTVKTPPPIATPIPQPAPAASGSANFGELQGSGSKQATSAADILRQRQSR